MYGDIVTTAATITMWTLHIPMRNVLSEINVARLTLQSGGIHANRFRTTHVFLCSTWYSPLCIERSQRRVWITRVHIYLCKIRSYHFLARDLSGRYTDNRIYEMTPVFGENGWEKNLLRMNNPIRSIFWKCFCDSGSNFFSNSQTLNYIQSR